MCVQIYQILSLVETELTVDIVEDVCYRQQVANIAILLKLETNFATLIVLVHMMTFFYYKNIIKIKRLPIHESIRLVNMDIVYVDVNFIVFLYTLTQRFNSTLE